MHQDSAPSSHPTTWRCINCPMIILNVPTWLKTLSVSVIAWMMWTRRLSSSTDWTRMRWRRWWMNWKRFKLIKEPRYWEILYFSHHSEYNCTIRGSGGFTPCHQQAPVDGVAKGAWGGSVRALEAAALPTCWELFVGNVEVWRGGR